VARAPLGRDLAARCVLVSRLYGALRPALEEGMLMAPDLMFLNMAMFAGRPITPATLAHVAGTGSLGAARRALDQLTDRASWPRPWRRGSSDGR
jgi:hypothetical protein